MPDYVVEDYGDALRVGDVKVRWVELGEGYNGDYDADNLEDRELLRFDVLVRGNLITTRSAENEMLDEEWACLPKGSYCTNFAAEAPQDERLAGLKLIMDRCYLEVSSGGSYKYILQDVSWMDEGWLKATDLEWAIGQLKKNL